MWRICLRQPYSFRVAEKNMERKVHQRGAEKAPLSKHPQCGKRKTVVPHNGSLNLSVHPSFSAWTLLPRGACSAPRRWYLVLFSLRSKPFLHRAHRLGERLKNFHPQRHGRTHRSAPTVYLECQPPSHQRKRKRHSRLCYAFFIYIFFNIASTLSISSLVGASVSES